VLDQITLRIVLSRLMGSPSRGDPDIKALSGNDPPGNVLTLSWGSTSLDKKGVVFRQPTP